MFWASEKWVSGNRGDRAIALTGESVGLAHRFIDGVAGWYTTCAIDDVQLYNRPLTYYEIMQIMGGVSPAVTSAG